MAKRGIKEIKAKAVSCNDCSFQDLNPDYPTLMWCAKIKMPMPKNNLKNCLFKNLKKCQ